MLLESWGPSLLPGFIISSKRREGNPADHQWSELCCRLRLSRDQRNPTGQESHDVHFSLTTTAPSLTSTSYPWVSSGILITLTSEGHRDCFQTFWKTVSESPHQIFIPSSQYDFFLLGPQILSVFSAHYTLINHCVISKGVTLNIKLGYAKYIVSLWVIVRHQKYCLTYLVSFPPAFLQTSVNHRFPVFHLVTI